MQMHAEREGLEPGRGALGARVKRSARGARVAILARSARAARWAHEARPATTRILATAGVLAAIGTGGCVTERVVTEDGLPAPARPRAYEPAERGIVPQEMILLVAPRTADTDGNGSFDSVEVTAALFNRDRHAMSLATPGTFTFEAWPAPSRGMARDAGALAATEPIARWRFGSETQAEAETEAIYGTCYRYRLDLSAAGVSDQMPAVELDVRATFQPEEVGSPLVRTSADPRLARFGG